jgi:hypothetical protein
MAEYWKYVGQVQLPANLASGITDEWEATLKAETSRIYTSLTTKIPDNTAFGTKIATPSSSAYNAFLQTVGGKWSITDIKLKQKVKLARSYTKWNERITAVFGGGSPTFPATVTAKKANLSELKRVVGAVGHKALEGWRPASACVLLARGDTRVSQYFTVDESLTGTLHAVFDATKGALIAPSLISEIVYACVMAKYADEAGLTTERGNIISGANTVLDALIQVALDATHLGGGYDFTIVLSWVGATTNNVLVTATDTHP